MTETYTLNLTYNHLVTIREAIRYKIEDTDKFLNDKGSESLANGRKGLANLNKIIAENELKEVQMKVKTRAELDKLGDIHKETYDDIIQRLIRFYKEHRDKK